MKPFVNTAVKEQLAGLMQRGSISKHKFFVEIYSIRYHRKINEIVKRRHIVFMSKGTGSEQNLTNGRAKEVTPVVIY
jgi:hypothetical protein